jgi:S-methylmethionine-dependent homocysteine/selenocysteine methylase
MKKRLDGLRRIERVQRQLNDLATWRLAALVRARESLEDNHREMLEAVGRDIASYGPLAVAATRRIRAIERQIDQAAAEHKSQSRAALDQAARAKLADQAVGAADARYRAQRERKDLAELIERSLGAAKASPT